MMNIGKNIPKISFAIVIVVLVLPFIQSNTHFYNEGALGGSIAEMKEPELSIDTWFSGDYQSEKEKKINSVFGFRNSSIRINNQIAFSFFKKAQANGVIIGKDNYLFEENYIKAYYGADFIGDDQIKERMEKLRFINDTLAKLNKTLILVFAAGKGGFFPEYIPDRFAQKKNRTNLEAYTGYANQFGLHYIDFNSYFIQQKYKSKYPLYPQHGVHWSIYGACLAADSIVHYIEKVRHIDMPEISWKEEEIKWSHEEYTDYDIGEGMNLLFRFNSIPMAYPNIHFESDASKVKPSLLVVSDSFYWVLYNMGISNVFSKTHFRYYNEQVYPENVNSGTLKLKDELDAHDVIVLMATDATLPGFGWKFIEQTYNFYKNIEQIEPVEFNRRVAAMKAIILANEQWVKDAEGRAMVKNITIDSSVTLDAIWEVKKQLNEVELKRQ